MIGRSVGTKPAKPQREKPCFGGQEPTFYPENAKRLGDSLLKPVQESPAFCGEQDRFQTDACASEQKQRQLQQQRYQAKLLEKGSFEAARAVGRQAHDENADLQALTRSQERVWGNKNSVGFNIIAPPGLPPEPLQAAAANARPVVQGGQRKHNIVSWQAR